MIPTKVRIVGAMLLVSALLTIFGTLQSRARADDAQEQAAKAMAAQQAAVAQAQGGTNVAPATPQVAAPKPSGAYMLGSMLGYGLTGLGVAMGLHLLVRGSADWIAKVLLIYLVLSVLGCLSVIGLMFKAPLLAVIVLVRLWITWWSYTVVSEDLRNGGSWRNIPVPTLEDEPVAAAAPVEPTALAAPAPPVGVVIPIPVVAAPTPLLHVQAPLDETGFGGWVQSPGSCELQLSPPPAGGAEVLVSDQAGTWHPMGTADPVTGMLSMPLPPANWYLLVRSATAAGAQTVVTVMPGAAAAVAPPMAA